MNTSFSLRTTLRAAVVFSCVALAFGFVFQRSNWNTSTVAVFAIAMFLVILLAILSFRVKESPSKNAVGGEYTDAELSQVGEVLGTAVKTDLQENTTERIIPISQWLPVEYYNHLEYTRRGTHGTPQSRSRLSTDLLFEKIDGGTRLLVLGKPGAGKSVLLYQLAWKLLQGHDRQDQGWPTAVPVWLSLNTWQDEYIDFEAWASKEIKQGYGTEAVEARALLEQGKLTLLLDGMNEIPPTRQRSFVTKINAYMDQHEATGVMISCQLEPFEDLWQNGVRLTGFQRAIEICRFDESQIEDILERSGLSAIALQTSENRRIIELARDPVYFSLLGAANPALFSKDDEVEATTIPLERRLQSVYCNRYIHTPAEDQRYFTSEEIVFWLKKLAKELKLLGDRSLRLDDIQPEQWFRNDKSSLRKYTLISILATTLIMSLFVGLGVITNRYAGCTDRSNCSFLVQQLQNCTRTYQPIGGIIGTVTFAIIFAIGFWRLRNRAFGLAFALAISSALGISEAFYGCHPTGAVIFFGNLFAWSMAGIFFFKPSSDVSNIAFDWRRIRVVERLAWNWQGAGIGILFGVTIGLSTGIATAVPGWGMAWGFGLSVIVVTLLGFKRIPEGTPDPSPIAGIRQSGRNAVLVGSISLVLGVVFVSAAFTLVAILATNGEFSDGLFTGVMGLGLGAIGMLFGGLTWLQHRIMMHLLTTKDEPVFPKNYLQFLDQAVDLRLLRLVHRRFEFVHELLFELFSDLNPQEERIILNHESPFTDDSPGVNIFEVPALVASMANTPEPNGSKIAITEIIQPVHERTRRTVLFLAANPAETTRLTLDEEFNEIEREMHSTKFREQFDVRRHGAVEVANLQRILQHYKPQIVHFGGHGLKSGELIFQDERGQPQPVSVGALSDTFRLLSDNLRCVVLFACFSETQAQAIAKHVDCVIGVPAEIEDAAARKFSVAFYRALGNGYNVQRAYELGNNELKLAQITDQTIMPRLFGCGDASQVLFAG